MTFTALNYVAVISIFVDSDNWMSYASEEHRSAPEPPRLTCDLPQWTRTA